MDYATRQTILVPRSPTPSESSEDEEEESFRPSGATERLKSNEAAAQKLLKSRRTKRERPPFKKKLVNLKFKYVDALQNGNDSVRNAADDFRRSTGNIAFGNNVGHGNSPKKSAIVTNFTHLHEVRF